MDGEIRRLLTSWEILSPCHDKSGKMLSFIFPYWNFLSSDKGKGQKWLVVTPQGLWGVNDGLFSPEWRGKRLHDIEIQSATWTTNPEVFRLFHKVALKVGLILPRLYSTVSLSLPGLPAILI